MSRRDRAEGVRVGTVDCEFRGPYSRISRKTHLTSSVRKPAAIGAQYIRLPEMIEMLNSGMETDPDITSIVKKLSNYHLLILDKWLLDISTGQKNKYLLEIFEFR